MKDIKGIVKWLKEIEHMAGDLYLQAASIYADDPTFKNFLEHLAEDEAWHYHLMENAAVLLTSEPDLIPVISIDEETNEKIVKQLTDIKDGLEEKSLSKNELLEKIVELELSEWNDIFLYVVTFLTEKTTEFNCPAARIQAHVKKIEYYLETIENLPNVLQKIRKLTPIWVENILIVDDEQMITNLLNSLLYREGNIEIAHNGQEALKMVEERYYKLIISDIDMPIMDGITFYQEVVTKFPASSSRFIFITGDITPEKQAFFNENQVKYLSKPMEIKVLREEASKTILSK